MKTKLALVTFVAATALSTLAQAADIDWKKVDAALGKSAAVSGDVHRYGLPRSDLKVTLDGVTIKPALALGGWVAFAPMGGANAINFQPTGSGKAAITGDFLVTGDEVNPLIRALRANDIEVTAIHSHMLGEQPRLFFIHFWANDDATKLARGIRAALEKTAIAKS